MVANYLLSLYKAEDLSRPPEAEVVNTMLKIMKRFKRGALAPAQNDVAKRAKSEEKEEGEI